MPARPPRWKVAYDNLTDAGELNDREWAAAGVPYSKWPEEVLEFGRQRTARRDAEREANRTPEQREAIRLRDQRTQAWVDQLAANKEKWKDEEILSRWDGGDPTPELAQEAYTNQELQRIEADHVAEQAQAIFDKGDYLKAGENAEIALSLDPNNQTAINILGMVQEFGVVGMGSRTPGVSQYEPTPLSPANIAPVVSPPPPPPPPPIPTPTTSTNTTPAVVAQTGTNTPTADAAQPDEDWLTSLSAEDQQTLIANTLDFADETRDNQLEVVSESQWLDELEREVARLAFPNEELSTAIQMINTREWLDSGALGHLENRAANNLRKRFRTPRSDNPNRSRDNRQKAADLIRQHGR